MKREVEVVTPDEDIAEIDRDPEDDRSLECAVVADAEYIVSGDDHLLGRRRYRDAETATPAL